jgi:hypothetical protein
MDDGFLVGDGVIVLVGFYKGRSAIVVQVLPGNLYHIRMHSSTGNAFIFQIVRGDEIVTF